MSLPMDAQKRKQFPLGTGVIDYFPDALLAIAEVSRLGNDQHNPGQPLFWDRTKSTDEADAMMRHFVERGTRDSDGMRHSAKMAWRALALLQKEIELEESEPSCNPNVTEAPRRIAWMMVDSVRREIDDSVTTVIDDHQHKSYTPTRKMGEYPMPTGALNTGPSQTAVPPDTSGRVDVSPPLERPSLQGTADRPKV